MKLKHNDQVMIRTGELTFEELIKTSRGTKKKQIQLASNIFNNVVKMVRVTDDVKNQKAGKKKVIQRDCSYCDGCGWYEGGKYLQTQCEQCNGTGKI